MADETPEKTSEQVEAEAGIQADADRQALIERAQKRLDAVPGIEPTPGKPEDKPVSKPPETPVAEAMEESEEKLKEAPAEEAVETGDEGPVEPTLPSAYRRSLKAYDWTDEDIAAAFEAAPDKFLETAERIHRNRNAETAGYAEAGRRVRADTAQPGVGSEVVDRKPQAPVAVKPVDVEAVIQEHGDVSEDLVRELTTPVNAAIEQVNALLPQLRESANEVKQARVEALGKQVETFFTGKELEPYTEVYGDVTKTSLTSTQQENRNKVLELADAISVGASLQGRQLAVDECLLMAHDNVAGDFKEAAIRTDLKKKTKKRAKGTIVKPSHGGKPPGTGKPTTRAELIAKVEAGMPAVFGR